MYVVVVVVVVVKFIEAKMCLRFPLALEQRGVLVAEIRLAAGRQKA